MCNYLLYASFVCRFKTQQMKTVITYLSLIILTSPLSGELSDVNNISKPIDISILKGYWKIDLSPEDKNDDNFAKMIISSVGKNSIEGFFYRDGVKIKEGRITISQGIIYAALISGDKSGTYNTSFYYKNDVLYGTTHSLKKDFLAVWEGVKITK